MRLTDAATLTILLNVKYFGYGCLISIIPIKPIMFVPATAHQVFAVLGQALNYVELHTLWLGCK